MNRISAADAVRLLWNSNNFSTYKACKKVLGRLEVGNDISADMALILIVWLRVIRIFRDSYEHPTIRTLVAMAI